MEERKQVERKSIWQRIKESIDFARFVPRRITQTEESRLSNSYEGVYYIIKNVDEGKYLKLSQEDYFIWQDIDGEKSVKDIVLDYFKEFGSFGFNRIATLVAELKEQGFLENTNYRVFSFLKKECARRTRGHFIMTILGAFFHKECAIKKIDKFVSATYKFFFWLFFTKIAKFFYILISVIGTGCFIYLVYSQKYSIVETAGSYGAGIVLIILLDIVIIFIHEGAHAYATKSYNRDVTRGGFLFYYGIPAFFVDTTDIWLENKKKRIAVSWAGPYSELILGSVLSIIIFVFPSLSANDLMFKFAFLFFLGVFNNLNPLLEMDGYYLLMDWLEIPMLRKRSFTFLKTRFWEKVKSHEKFSRREKIFSVFGILAFVYTVSIILLVIYFWQTRIYSGLVELWQTEGILSKLLVLAVGALIIVPIAYAVLMRLYRWAKSAYRWLAKRKLLRQPYFHVILVAAVLGSIVFVTPLIPPRVLPFVTLAFLAVLLFGVGRSSVKIVKLYRQSLRNLFFIAFVIYFFVSFFDYVTFAAISMRSLFDVPSVMTLASFFQLYIVSLALGAILLLVSLYEICNYATTKLALPFVFLFLSIVCKGAFFYLGLHNSLIFASAAVAGHIWLGFAGFVFFNFIYSRLERMHKVDESEVLFFSEKELLFGAYEFLAESLMLRFANVFGTRKSRLVKEQYNAYMRSRGYQFTFTGDDIERGSLDQLSVIALSEILKDGFENFTGLVSKHTGKKFVEENFDHIFDSLYWQERELATEYLFKDEFAGRQKVKDFNKNKKAQATLLRENPIFADVNEEELARIVAKMREEKFHPGDVIIKQGDAGDKFYVITLGKVDVQITDAEGVTSSVATLYEGDYFGEIALLKNVTRTASCIAQTAVKVFSLGKEDFEALLKKRFELFSSVEKAAAISNLVRQLPSLAEFTPTQLRHLISKLELETVPEDTLVIKRGDIGREFYIILSGNAEVFLEDEGGHKKTIATLGKGEYFGEIALLTDVTRTANVRTVSSCDLLVLHKEDFDEIIKKHVFGVQAFGRTSSRRMIDLGKKSTVLGS